jgi:hypothetical protein
MWAFCRSHLGNVHMKRANWVGLELLLGRCVAFAIWQAVDAMRRSTAVQRRSRQVGNGSLQGI